MFTPNYWLLLGTILLLGGWHGIEEDRELAFQAFFWGSLIALVGVTKFLNRARREMRLFLGANIIGFLCGRTVWSYLPDFSWSIQETELVIGLLSLFGFSMGYQAWMYIVGKQYKGSVWLPANPDPSVWKMWRLNVIFIFLTLPDPAAYAVWTFLALFYVFNRLDHMSAERLEEKRKYLGKRARILSWS